MKIAKEVLELRKVLVKKSNQKFEKVLCIESKGQCFRAIATDRKVLCVIEGGLPNQDLDTGTVYLDIKTLDAIKKQIDKREEYFEIQKKDNGVEVKVNNTTVIQNNYEYSDIRYPDFDKVIPDFLDGEFLKRICFAPEVLKPLCDLAKSLGGVIEFTFHGVDKPVRFDIFGNKNFKIYGVVMPYEIKRR